MNFSIFFILVSFTVIVRNFLKIWNILIIICKFRRFIRLNQILSWIIESGVINQILNKFHVFRNFNPSWEVYFIIFEFKLVNLFFWTQTLYWGSLRLKIYWLIKINFINKLIVNLQFDYSFFQTVFQILDLLILILSLI